MDFIRSNRNKNEAKQKGEIDKHMINRCNRINKNNKYKENR